MNRRPLGDTGMRVSEICFGCWAIGGPFFVQNRAIGWGQVDDEISVRAIRRGIELGINFFDTANVYGFGHSEEIVRRALEGVREEVFIASKVGFLREPRDGKNQDFSDAAIRRSCEESLKRLGRETLDLYQLHSVPEAVVRRPEVFESLGSLKKEGKIRAIGVTVETDAAAIAAMENPAVKSVQIIFNILRQKPARTVFPAAAKKNAGILPRVPLASGLLTGTWKKGKSFPKDDHRSQPLPGETFSGLKLQDGLFVVEKLRPIADEAGECLTALALKWIASFDAVSSIIVGMKTPAQVEENIQALEGRPLPPHAVDKINSVYRERVAALVESRY